MRVAGFKALLLCCLAAFVGAARAETVETYTVRDWGISAHRDDRTKAFSHCAMSADYKNGVILIFGVSRDKEWFMGLANQNWELTEGNRYNFDIELDGARGNRWYGVAVSANAIRVPLADSASLFERFSAAKLLTIRAASSTFRFDLANSRVALEAVVACSARYLAKENTNPFQNNPFARAPKAPGSKVNDEQFYSEAAIVMTNMLSEIGSVGHRLLPVQTLRDEFKGYHAIWVGNGAAGSLKILPQSPPLEEVGSLLLSQSAQECDGRFASGKSSVEDKAVKIAAVCEDKKGKVSNYSYIVAQRDGGGAYLFSVVALEQSADSAKEAARVGDLIVASARK
jgi:hypothetical protein